MIENWLEKMLGDVAIVKTSLEFEIEEVSSIHAAENVWEECWRQLTAFFQNEKAKRLVESCGMQQEDFSLALDSLKESVLCALYYFGIEYVYFRDPGLRKHQSDIYDASFIYSILGVSHTKGKTDSEISETEVKELYNKVKLFLPPKDIDKIDPFLQDVDIEPDVKRDKILTALEKGIRDKTRFKADKTGKRRHQLFYDYKKMSYAKTWNPFELSEKGYCNLFFHETVEYIAKVFSLERIVSAEEEKEVISFHSVIRELPILLMMAEQDLPGHKNTINGGLTFERLQDTAAKIRLFRNFHEINLVDWFFEETDRSHVERVMYEWAAEELLHQERTSEALDLLLEVIEKQAQIDEEKVGRLQTLASLLCYFPMDLLPTSLHENIRRIAEAIVHDEAYDEGILKRFFLISGVIYPSLVLMGAWILYTGNANSLSKEELLETIKNLTKAVGRIQLDISGLPKVWEKNNRAFFKEIRSRNKKGKEHEYTKVMLGNTLVEGADLTNRLVSQINIAKFLSLTDYYNAFFGELSTKIDGIRFGLEDFEWPGKPSVDAYIDSMVESFASDLAKGNKEKE